MKKLLIVTHCLLGILSSMQAQNAKTIVYGKVTEASTGTPVPFANVFFIGTQDGGSTDFDGNFMVSTSSSVDSLEVSYIGFLKKVKIVSQGQKQQIDFQLEENLVTLGEVVVYAGENPAWEILRRVVDRKDQNDKRSLDAFEYESYTKIELDVDNISNTITKRKIVSNIKTVLDSIQQIAGEDGRPVLPIFMSEALSRYYQSYNPTLAHEEVLKTKVSGVGITDGTTSSQIIGASFQNYNFYRNWLNIISKEFVSPISNSWKLYYDYDLMDSLDVDGDFCYKIDFKPKREQDLAFVGTMWITKNEYALKRIDATVPRAANINFVEKLKIQQDLIKTEAGPWLPQKTRVVVDIIQMTKFGAGLLAKFYVSTADYKINEPKERAFYLNPVSLDEEARVYDDTFWEEHRHDSLTSTEQNVFLMIDTLKNIPIVKNTTNIAKFLIGGYYRIGDVDYGPYTTFFGNNNVEGVRVGFGARSTIALSNKWTIGGYFGYGFGDDEWKYRVFVDRILSRQPWSSIRFEYQKEVEQVWLLNENLDPSGLFFTLSRFGDLEQPFLTHKYRVQYNRQLGTGFNANLMFKHEQFSPLFDFGYYNPSRDRVEFNGYDVNEISTSIRYAKDEKFIMDDNNRVSVGTVRSPAFTLDYTLGVPSVLGSDLDDYHKFKLTVEKRQKLGFMGVGIFKLTSGYILGNVPYPLLYNPIGNPTPVMVDFAFNQMRYFEFSTDKFIEFRYAHSFEGLLLNGIPLLKKLKLRAIANLNVLYGTIDEKNVALTGEKYGLEWPNSFTKLDRRPYVEVGYGVENILRVLTVQAFHRLTYLDSPEVNKFGIKFKFAINL